MNVQAALIFCSARTGKACDIEVYPELRKAYVCSATGFQEPEGGLLAVPGTAIRVVLSELFAELDRG